MFTGIVTGLGRVVSLESRRGGGALLTVAPPQGYGRFVEGESLCVSGVCLTATAGGRRFVADLSGETLARSTLGGLRPGDAVNLEKALAWGDRLSGHFVLGHVDGVGEVLTVHSEHGDHRVRVRVPRDLVRYLAARGSVAVDGVSLTVADADEDGFTVALIPTTLQETVLGSYEPGRLVNVEVDVVARYLERLTKVGRNP